MLLVLHGLLDDYSLVGDQILGSSVVPNSNSTFSTLLRVPSKPTNYILAIDNDSSALVSQHDDRYHPRKSGKGRHKCEHVQARPQN